MRKGQAYQRKTEKFFVYEEKKVGRIDSLTRVSALAGLGKGILNWSGKVL